MTLNESDFSDEPLLTDEELQQLVAEPDEQIADEDALPASCGSCGAELPADGTGCRSRECRP